MYKKMLLRFEMPYFLTLFQAENTKAFFCLPALLKGVLSQINVGSLFNSTKKDTWQKADCYICTVIKRNLFIRIVNCPFVRSHSLNSILLIKSNDLAIIPISHNISFLFNCLFIFVANTTKMLYLCNDNKP